VVEQLAQLRGAALDFFGPLVGVPLAERGLLRCGSCRPEPVRRLVRSMVECSTARKW
jgi:hypothetical protein